jgi:hypothetical protein
MTAQRLNPVSYARSGQNIGYCGPCDKKIHLSRKAARRAGRKTFSEQGSGRPRAYPCPHVRGQWHVGHLPDGLRRGQFDRDDYREGLGKQP